jgi:hypothetical protein
VYHKKNTCITKFKAQAIAKNRQLRKKYQTR